MKHIDVLVQGEGFTDIQVVTVESEASVDTLFETIGRKRAAGDGEELIFVEDFAVPVDTDMLFAELLPEGIETEAGGECKPLRLHIHRCRRVEVSVRFNGQTATRRFGPSTTIHRVHHWAARRAFGLSPRDAAEHVLQIQGTSTRPDRDVHIGTLVACSVCALAFNLVPFKRVEG